MKKNFIILSVFLTLLSSICFARVSATKDPLNKPTVKEFLGICSVFKTQAPYLKEWIEYHRMQGVQVFYLFDQGNDAEYKQSQEVLKPYIEDGIVKLYRCQEGSSAEIYNYCVNKVDGRGIGGLVHWVAFIDVNEFLFPTGKETVKSICLDYVNKRCNYVSVPGKYVGMNKYKGAYDKKAAFRDIDIAKGKLVTEIFKHVMKGAPKKELSRVLVDTKALTHFRNARQIQSDFVIKEANQKGHVRIQLLSYIGYPGNPYDNASRKLIGEVVQQDLMSKYRTELSRRICGQKKSLYPEKQDDPKNLSSLRQGPQFGMH